MEIFAIHIDTIIPTMTTSVYLMRNIPFDIEHRAVITQAHDQFITV